MRPIPAFEISNGVQALSNSLSDTLSKTILKSVKKAAGDIAYNLRRGEFQTAQRLSRELKFTEAVSGTTATVRKFTRSAALLGAGAVDSPKTAFFASGAPWPWEVDNGAVRLVQASVARALDRTKRDLEDRVVSASKFQKADPINPQKLANDINRYLRGEIRRVVDVSANVVGTRTAAYGMYYEARVRGIAEYRIDAVLDTRTTEICKAMDGRIFSVEEAFTRTGQALSTSDPTAQKNIAPFPPSDLAEIQRIKEMDAADLQARGFDTPPFHFLCRSVVTLASSDTQYDPVAWSNYPEGNDVESHARAMVPKYDRIARTLWKEDDLDKLFTVALKSGPNSGIDDIYHVNAYTGNTYSRINETLRRNSPFEADSELPSIVRTMDKMIANSEAPDVTYVYRGITSRGADKLAVGKVFQDDGFLSTTLDLETAAGFAGETGAVLHIQVGTGKSILPAYRVSLLPAEQEMILPRGAQLRIIGDSIQEIGGVRVRVYRAVFQGAGDTLPVDKLGLDDFPPAVSLSKADERLMDKYVTQADDFREATFTG